MTDFSGRKYILWDFDGVIIDSHEVRESGFRIVLSEFPEKEVEELLEYHRENGGLSRYVKFRYFFEKIRKEAISEAGVNALAARFSELMRGQLIDKKNLIPETLDFIKDRVNDFNMHIISGSDGEELRYLCDRLDIKEYFKSIDGSPIPKVKLVEDLLKKYSYHPDDGVLIGDSINDYEAAKLNGVDFRGYNNPALEKTGQGYIYSFS